MKEVTNDYSELLKASISNPSLSFLDSRLLLAFFPTKTGGLWHLPDKDHCPSPYCTEYTTVCDGGWMLYNSGLGGQLFYGAK